MNKEAKKIKPIETAFLITREDKALYHANKGMQYQDNALKAYCRKKGIKIDFTCYEDGKDVTRIDFYSLLEHLKKPIYINPPTYILFTTWDIVAPLFDQNPKAMKLILERGVLPKSIFKFQEKNKQVTDKGRK